MEITFSKEQLRHLAMLTYIGNWVVNADRSEDEQNEGCNSVEQLVLRALLKQGFEELVDGPDEDGHCYASSELEDEAETYLDEYERGYLLEDIAVQLARRDLADKLGEASVAQLEPEILAAKLNPHLSEYMNEFDEHGIQNLKIVK